MERATTARSAEAPTVGSKGSTLLVIKLAAETLLEKLARKNGSFLKKKIRKETPTISA